MESSIKQLASNVRSTTPSPSLSLLSRFFSDSFLCWDEEQFWRKEIGAGTDGDGWVLILFRFQAYGYRSD